MNDNLQYLITKYGLDVSKPVIEIPNTGRETLAALFKDLGFMVGAEIGVERGLYSEILLKANVDLFLYCIDYWTPYKGYRDHVTEQKLNTIFHEASERLQPYNCTLVHKKSMDAVKDFEDESLDFVYIDANHEFQHVVDDICQWQKKVKVGGIIAGHDYIRRKVTHKKQEYLMHVIPAVHGFIDAYNIKPLFILGSKMKREGELRDSPRSWFYIKPTPRKVVSGHETA